MSALKLEDSDVSRYQVKILVFRSGERFPILLASETGSPDFDSTVFSLQMMRSAGYAHRSITQALRSIAILLEFLEDRSIDLRSRCRNGLLLTLSEIEALYRLSRLARIKTESAGSEFVRMQTTSIRLFYMAQYISWIAKSELYRLPQKSPERSSLTEELADSLEAIRHRQGRPDPASLDPREGLDHETLVLLREALDPKSANNPFRDDFLKLRNHLMFTCLQSLAMRRGELAGLRIRDINAQFTKVGIVRRADDPEDPRRDQPNAKTLGKQVELPVSISREMRDYLVHRRRIKGATKHDFLFVSSSSGAPLSLIAINKVFETLRVKVPALGQISPHVLRHTFNDGLSHYFDERQPKLPPHVEQDVRSELNGWSKTSQTAASYTRRHTREEATRALLEMQEDD